MIPPVPVTNGPRTPVVSVDTAPPTRKGHSTSRVVNHGLTRQLRLLPEMVSVICEVT